MPNFEDDSGNCHAPDPNGVACYKSRIGCPIHPRQKRKCHECSELSALRLDNERLRAENESLCAEIERIEKDCLRGFVHEIERLRGAMQFYADPNRYKSTSVHMCGHSTGQSVMIDGGRKAREALGVKS